MQWEGDQFALFHTPKWISDGLRSTCKKCITFWILWNISLVNGHEYLLQHKKKQQTLLLMASPHFHQVADCICSFSPLRSPPWSLLWGISTMELHCQWPTASGRTRQCLDPTAIEYCTDFHLRRGRGEATVYPCTGLSWYLSQKADPDFSIKVLPTLCLRLPGESKTENQDAGFQQ